MSSVLEGLKESTSAFKEFREYFDKNPNSLVGYVMDLGYENGIIITNDFYKLRNNGIPKNSFLFLHLLDEELTRQVPEHYVLTRVTEPTTTPLSGDVSKTYFELHKNHMPEIDIFTKAELQWSALKVSILGTYYANDRNEIEFAGDIESYFCPHLYAVYVPSDKILTQIINNPIKTNPFVIGKVRFTESKLYKTVNVDVKVSVDDFIGARTALFGKTRMGKSNTVKIIAEAIMGGNKSVGQVIFDLNGEYANVNEQDKTSLYEKFKEKCIRFSANPKEGMETLKVNMYEDLKLGHEILKQLMAADGIKADYLNGFLNLEMLGEDDKESIKNEDFSEYNRYMRKEGLFKCILKQANFKVEKSNKIPFNIRKDILSKAGIEDSAKFVSLDEAIHYYSKIWDLYISCKGKEPFNSSSITDDHSSDNQEKKKTKINKPYFDETDISLLTILTGKKDGGTPVSGAKKLSRYTEYHDTNAKDAINKIINAVEEGKTVILDLSNSNPVIINFFSEKICTSIFGKQMDLFTRNDLKGKYVQFYFEEAHNLFPSTDKDLTNIYNRLAKEGAKLNIGLIYSTQSISSLSRDLLKNTENFFIAHLNDQNEIKELTKFYEFKDVAIDVQKTKSKGFVRMITKSHQYALPVQIKLFGA